MHPHLHVVAEAAGRQNHTPARLELDRLAFMRRRHADNCAGVVLKQSFRLRIEIEIDAFPGAGVAEHLNEIRSVMRFGVMSAGMFAAQTVVDHRVDLQPQLLQES